MNFRYKELDALRGIAALFVVLFHFSMGREQLKLGFFLGVTGVDLFFIISGFVIFMSINHVSKVSEFAVNRFTRLYPTYWACVTLTFLLKLIANGFFQKVYAVSFYQYLINLTMFQHHFKVPSMDDSYWTMIVEMWFYVLIGLLFAIGKIKRIVPIGLLFLGIVLISELFPQSSFSKIFNVVNGHIPFLHYIPLFFAGISFFKIIEGKGNSASYYLIILLCFIIKSIPTDTGGFVNHLQYVSMLFVYFLLFILFVNQKLSFLISKPLLFLGKISFALYLVHQFISTEIVLPFLLEQCKMNYWFSALITLLLVILIATGITFVVEIPLGKKMNLFLRSKMGLEKRL